jgi:uncharacterized membrane protein
VILLIQKTTKTKYMNPTHIHLLISHLPIFGVIIGVFVLGFGMLQGSNPTKKAAYLVFIVSGIGAAIAYFTGEGAEETVENITGISENIIGQHEKAALYTLISLIILGITSIASLFVTQKKVSLAKYTSMITLFIALISTTLVARTGYLGGQIRHTEISTSGVQQNGGTTSTETDDD